MHSVHRISNFSEHLRLTKVQTGNMKQKGAYNQPWLILAYLWDLHRPISGKVTGAEVCCSLGRPWRRYCYRLLVGAGRCPYLGQNLWMATHHHRDSQTWTWILETTILWLTTWLDDHMCWSLKQHYVRLTV